MPNYDPALLERIKQLVPISRLVGEYVEADARKSTPGDLWGLCPFHSEATPSFHADDSVGVYKCFGCDAKGDHFRFLEEHQGMTFPQAVQRVSDLAGVSLPGSRQDPAQPAPRARYEAPERKDPYAGYEFLQVPVDAPPIKVSKKSPPIRKPREVGTDKEFTNYTPEAVYPYHSPDGALLGYVIRQRTAEGKKLTPGIWWMRDAESWEGWSHGSLPSLRPLYGLLDLLAHTDKQVLVVEGEKCKDAAAGALDGRVIVVSWLGGTSAVKQTDWTPLAGRSVIWWPDNDAPGAKAMQAAMKLAGAAKNKRIEPYGSAGGDVADLIADGLDVADYIKANISEWKETEDGISVDVADNLVGNHSNSGGGDLRYVGDRGGDYDSEGASREPVKPRAISAPAEIDPLLTADDGRWEDRLIHTEAGTLAKKSPQNAMLHIQFHDDFKGIFAHNSFNSEIMLMRRPPWEPGTRKWVPRVMDEDDETALQGQLEYCGLSIGINDLSRCVSRVAKFNRFNPVLDHIKSLQWDGVPRISDWLVKYLGAEASEINRVFARKFLVSSCSRIERPGTKVDTVLIIEGKQGSMKSSSLKALCSVFGREYFLDNLADPYGKDGKMAVQGKLIVELAELEAFSRSEVRQEKSYIATEVDEFRPPYARQVRKFPRTFVLTGSTNQGEDTGYLKDRTGARRFWPVLTSVIDLEALEANAEQMWAEAYSAYKAGEIWWLTKDEETLAAVEQRKRFKHDPWLPSITKALMGETSTNPVKLMELLDIPKKDRTVAGNDRIVAVLTMMQWEARTVDGEIHYYRPVLN